MCKNYNNLYLFFNIFEQKINVWASIQLAFKILFGYSIKSEIKIYRFWEEKTKQPLIFYSSHSKKEQTEISQVGCLQTPYH